MVFCHIAVLVFASLVFLVKNIFKKLQTEKLSRLHTIFKIKQKQKQVTKESKSILVPLQQQQQQIYTSPQLLQ